MLIVTKSAVHDGYINRTYFANAKYQRILIILDYCVFGVVRHTSYLVLIQFNDVIIRIHTQKSIFGSTQDIEFHLYESNKRHDFLNIYDQYTYQIYMAILDLASRGKPTVQQICDIDIDGHAFQWSSDTKQYAFGKVFQWSEFFRGAWEAERNRMRGSLLGQFVSYVGRKILSQ